MSFRGNEATSLHAIARSRSLRGLRLLCAATLGSIATLSSIATAGAAPTVWVVDDGEKIKATDAPAELARGERNPIWTPNQPIRLFALRNETVAFQVAVHAGDGALGSVTIDLPFLRSDAGARIENGPAAPPLSFVGRRIERFVEHFVEVKRASGGVVPRESLGWAAGSGPSQDRWVGWVPDALIPIENAPVWSPYPLRVEPNRNGIVWFDVTVARDTTPGIYRGEISVRDGSTALALLPIEVDVLPQVLPDRPAKTMIFYAREELDSRIAGGDATEMHFWQLLHRHRLTALHDAMTVSDAEHHLPALDGSAFVALRGYEGPGENLGDGVLSLGTYGRYREPDSADLRNVEAIADFANRHSLFGNSDIFIYAIDEQCSSPFGRGWRNLLRTSTNPYTKHVRVGWTCSEDPVGQPVDIPMMIEHYDPARANAAKLVGKEVWLYNGVRPYDGTFLIDSDAVNPRVNGWLSAMFRVPRWFYWESTFWDDSNRGGQGPIDPFVTAENFHNQHGDWCAGDGLLVYPGRQVNRFADHSVGFPGVLPSIRLKNWRRGIQDAGYFHLAEQRDAAAASRIAASLIPKSFSSATKGDPPSWPERGNAFFQARRKLLDIFHSANALNGAKGLAEPLVSAERTTNPSQPLESFKANGETARGCNCISGCSRHSTAWTTMTLPIVAIVALIRRKRRAPQALRTPDDRVGKAS